MKEGIVRRLLKGALPVCCSCRRVLEDGDPKVGVRLSPASRTTYWRCGDCEYREVHG